MASYPTIKLGSTGEPVSTWQGLLSKANFYTDVTGKFDQATHEHTKAWQASVGFTGQDVDGVVGPKSWSKMTGVTVTPPAGTDKNAQFGRDVLKNVWKKVTGEEPTLTVLQMAGAQAHLESNYGKASYKLLDHKTGQTIATSGQINNWGAVQGQPGFLATDTSPHKVTADNPKGYYDHHYRTYATPEEGAEHFVKHMTVLRPHSWAAMKAGDIDEWARRMHSYNPVGSKTLNPDPITGTLGYFEQDPSQRAKGIEQRVANIANTLGEKVMAKRGGPIETGGAEPNGGSLSTGKKVGLGASILFIGAGIWAFIEAWKRW